MSEDPEFEMLLESQREELRGELDALNYEIDSFWEREDADEMEDTYGDLMEERDAVQSKLNDLR